MNKKIQEIINLSDIELDDKLVALKQKLIEARLLAASGRLEKPAVIKNTKKEIARIMTIKKAKNG